MHRWHPHQCAESWRTRRVFVPKQERRHQLQRHGEQDCCKTHLHMHSPLTALLILLQVVCDANLHFTNLLAKYAGAAHDSYVCRMSELYELFEKKQLQGLILGDRGYPCRPWLLTPIRNPKSAVEREFNRRHKKTRVLVEQSIGVLKRRFKILDNKIRMHIDQVRNYMVSAAFTMHIAAFSATGAGRDHKLRHPAQHHPRA